MRPRCRCPGGAAGALPEPLITVQADQQAECDPADWQRSWRATVQPYHRPYKGLGFTAAPNE